MAEGAAAALGAAGLFKYNRDNFMYDRDSREETEYNIMDFRIEQANLWREDVRDIIELAGVKMDSYMMISTVELGMVTMLFVEGRFDHEAPNWLLGGYMLSLAGAFMYLLISIWFSLQTSVAAKSYNVRLMTQLVRLPVPTWSQVEAARTYGSAFEQIGPQQMFRVPFLQGRQEGFLARRGSCRANVVPPAQDAPRAARSPAAEGETPSDVWGLEASGEGLYELSGHIRNEPNFLRHLQLVREATKHWQSYDGFSRATMSIGTNQLMQAITYYVVGYIVIYNHAIVAAMLVVLIFVSMQMQLIYLDMSLTATEYRLAIVLTSLGPVFATICGQCYIRHECSYVGEEVEILTPAIYAMHAVWIMFMLYICKIDEQASGALLPTGFRSVMYIDIFGWHMFDREVPQAPSENFEVPGSPLASALQRRRVQARRPDLFVPVEPDPFLPNGSGFAQAGDNEQPNDWQAGRGPAVQAVRHDASGRPLPVRPEQLLGASERLEPTRVEGEDLDPSTFVTHEECLRAEQRPGLVPWRIFCGASIMLIFAWVLVGLEVLYEALGYTYYHVVPLIEGEFGEPHGHGEAPSHSSGAHHGEALLQAKPATLRGGRVLATRWPRSGLHPRALSCGEARDGLGPWVVAATRFSVLASRLSLNATASASEALSFEAAPFCEALEGESVHDVAVRCHEAPMGAPVANSSNPCSVLVLHHQGRRLASCPLSEDASRVAAATVSTARSSQAPWLRGAEALRAEVASIAFGGAALCGGLGACGYLQTSEGRLIEIEAEDEGATWRQRRVVPRARRGNNRWSSKSSRSGSLSIIGDSRHYLLALHPEGSALEAVSLRSGRRGSWRLPREHSWVATCSAGDSIYLLPEGPSPQLWRFPLPSPLDAAAQPPLDAAQLAVAAQLAEARARLRRQAMALLSVGGVAAR